MPTTLKPGDNGVLVKRLQAALIGLGYDLGPSGADGDFGERTRAAVAGFQESRGLEATGVADPPTIEALDLDPETLEDLIELDGESSTASEPSTTTVATVEGDDVYLDPPVRLWPQYDTRWKHERIAGPRTGRLLDWVSNGCNASSAAMTLRWFAEDCTAGTMPFPTKPDGSIDASWYGLRMGEAFWPNADPPGKVELTPEGRIHFRKLYSVAAHYLKTGEIERNERGDVVDPSGPRAHYVTRQPSEGWLELIRTLLKAGPVIVGIGAPAGHFVVAHGVVGGALLVADPGCVLYQAHHGGGTGIENWKGKEGYLDGTMDRDQVRMPSPSQWPEGSAPGQEGDARSYHLISGQFLDDLLAHLISVTSLTYPEGARLAA
jgi:hypothetical protein